ncbi:expressed unknown protein [Seminavis robusta]|uniref:Secreted protein n=1 Tax=Seminavis robusta TaxID=568900 RepID=A0A9N8DQ55_9STRA|nr:expressed unknown protein [Seminavis robusta]|eukprot:Sro292_g109710.1 n/a (153) ;mRNA; f:66226-66684
MLQRKSIFALLLTALCLAVCMGQNNNGNNPDNGGGGGGGGGNLQIWSQEYQFQFKHCVLGICGSWQNLPNSLWCVIEYINTGAGESTSFKDKLNGNDFPNTSLASRTRLKRVNTSPEESRHCRQRDDIGAGGCGDIVSALERTADFELWGQC